MKEQAIKTIETTIERMRYETTADGKMKWLNWCKGNLDICEELGILTVRECTEFRAKAVEESSKFYD